MKIAAIIRSRLFFAATVALLVIEAGWIALSARFPMAFDEGFHVGIIKIYARQWSPLLTKQPPGPAPYGALTTDPSYLYHYLMSFPYRLLQHLGLSEMTTIISMRFLNIAFFAAGLIVFRRLLLKTKASPAIINAAILFFVLVPVVPLLAGQNNYDNLMFLVVAASLLLCVRFRQQLERQKSCNVFFLLNLVSLTLLGSLIKFAYLPIFAAIVSYLGFVLWKFHRGPRVLWRMLRKNWRAMSLPRQLVAGLLCLVSLGLFMQRYAYNSVKYHNPVPQCGQVLTVQQCSSYQPWARNYDFAKHKPKNGAGNPFYFTAGWLYGMFWRSFFAINGPGPTATYDNEPPLPLISAAAISIFVFGLYLVGRYRRELCKRDPALNLLLLAAAIYLVALIGRNYHDYLQLGQLVAINGRYLVQIMLPLLVVIGMAYRYFLQRRQYAAVFAIVLLLFLQGGGAVSFIADSTADWYWPKDRLALRLNQDAKHVIKPFLLTWPDH